MLQKWPVRRGRHIKENGTKYANGYGPTRIDTLFPIAIGGIAAIPGPLSGKTVVQHQLILGMQTLLFMLVVENVKRNDRCINGLNLKTKKAKH